MVMTKLKTAVVATVVLSLASFGGGALLIHSTTGVSLNSTQNSAPVVNSEPLAQRDSWPNFEHVVGDQFDDDRDGAPLPENAIMRLGTTRWRPVGGGARLVFAPDDKRQAIWSADSADQFALSI